MIKKNISKMLLAVILLFSLSACGELMSLLSDPYANVNGGGKPGNGNGGGNGNDNGTGGDTGGGSGGDTGGGSGGDTGGGTGGDTGGDTGGGTGGDTGGGTSFNIFKAFAPELYFGRAHLTADEQKAYDVILEGLLTYRDGVGGTFGIGEDARVRIDLEKYGIKTITNKDQITKILYTIVDDESRAYHIRSVNPRAEASGQTSPVPIEGSIKYFYVQLLDSLQTFAEYESEMKDIEVNVKKIIDVAEAKRALGYTDAQIATVIYETYLSGVAYGGMAKSHGGNIRGSFKYLTHDGRHVVVCEGYARSYLYLLQRVGIKGIYVEGTAITNVPGLHAWNKIQLNGKWYNADPTWDDTKVIDSPDSKKDDYLKSDTTFSPMHPGVNKDTNGKFTSYTGRGIQIPASDPNDFPASGYAH